MTRTILLTIGWLAAALGLYAGLVMLELYWNLSDWQPKLDSKALGLIIGICAGLVAIGFLARATRSRLSEGVSFVISLALLTLGAYVFPPEPLTQGLFAREQSSPFWYRAGRFVVLASPCVFWGQAQLRRRKLAAPPDEPPNDGPRMPPGDSGITEGPPSVN